jgi:hypothetical protein
MKFIRHHTPMMYAPQNGPYSCRSTKIALFWLKLFVVPSSFKSTQTAWLFTLWHIDVLVLPIHPWEAIYPSFLA